MSTYDVLRDCENDPPKSDGYGHVIAPNGSRAYLPSTLHGVVLAALLPYYRVDDSPAPKVEEGK